MSRSPGRRTIVHIADGRRASRTDHVAVEEPLQIRIDGEPLSVTMRTPGNDFELTAGFLYAEGVVSDRRDIVTMRYCAEDGPDAYNVVDVALSPGAPGAGDAEVRQFGITSACGVCGTTSIDSVRRRLPVGVAGDPLAVGTEVLTALPGKLREAQRVFERTGGLHAAGLFDHQGVPVCVREDVGRHNAFDKVIGWALTAGRLPLRSHMILASGRASFELTQKALVAGIPLLAAVSAPSSLAVELAREAGMTLVGFLRGQTMNVYSADHRVTGA